MKWTLLLLYLAAGLSARLSAAEEPLDFQLCSRFIDQVSMG